MLREHRRAGASLEAISSNEVRVSLLEIPESWHVEIPGPTVVQRPRLSDAILHQAGDPWSHHVLTEVVPDVAAGIAHAIRMRRRLRQEHQPGRFEGRRGENDDRGACFVASP